VSNVIGIEHGSPKANDWGRKRTPGRTKELKPSQTREKTVGEKKIKWRKMEKKKFSLRFGTKSSIDDMVADDFAKDCEGRERCSGGTN